MTAAHREADLHHDFLPSAIFCEKLVRIHIYNDMLSHYREVEGVDDEWVPSGVC